MYQLLCFFMLTDPPTTVGTKRGQVGVVIVIALVECLFRLANDFELPLAELVAPAPAIIALFLVGPIALAIDLRRRVRPAEPRPETGRGIRKSRPFVSAARLRARALGPPLGKPGDS